MLKLKKSLNKESSPEFIEKGDSIEYTQEDVDFYNEYFKDKNLREFKDLLSLGIFTRLMTITMIGFMFAIFASGFDAIKGIILTSSGVVIGNFVMTLGFVFECKGFKNALVVLKKFRKLKKMKDTKFNNHYYLKSSIEVKLREKNMKINENFLNKVIKKYPKNIFFKDLLYSESIKEDVINEYKVLSKYAND